VFGFSFGELVVLIIVAIVVIGPKDLPKVLRRVGQWAGKLRRMAADLRAQSGIDDVLRSEGLSEDIAEIRKLARGELDNVVRSARIDTRPVDPYASPASHGIHDEGFPVNRDRELPREGADSYRALPDTALVYAETLPASPHAKDALYMLGDAGAVMPEALPAEASDDAADRAHDPASPDASTTDEASPPAAGAPSPSPSTPGHA
jgi:sec-independent protein translocase protein TatB